MGPHGCFFFVINFICFCVAFEKIYVEDGVLIMDELVIKTNKDEHKLEYPHQQFVSMKSVYIPMLSASLLSRLKGTTELKVSSGVLATMEIPTHLITINLHSCLTDQIMIDLKRGDFKLAKLYVHHNLLRTIPENLSALTELVELVLNDNEIETVELGTFRGLNKLQVVGLHRNHITSVTTWEHKLIPLPALVNFYLDHNSIENVDFSYLLAESLATVHLHNNNLTMVPGLTRAFPKLSTIRMHGNPLECHWKDYVIEQLQTRQVTIADFESITCQKSAVDENYVDTAWEKKFVLISWRTTTEASAGINMEDDYEDYTY